MQGYLTLEEAARTLSIPVDELRQMAQKNQIRSFQDRGTLRFRSQDIQELARQRGLGNSQEEPVVPAPATPPKTPRVSEAGSGRASKKNPPISPSKSAMKIESISAWFPQARAKKILAPASAMCNWSAGIVAAQAFVRAGPTQPPSSVAPLITPSAKSKASAPAPSSAAKARSQPSAVRPKEKPSAASPTTPRIIAKESDSDVKIVGDPSVEATLGKSATDSEIPLYKPPSEEEALLPKRSTSRKKSASKQPRPRMCPDKAAPPAANRDASSPVRSWLPAFHQKEEGAGFDFSLEAGDEQVDVGRDAPSAPRSGKKPTSPPPGSDSDVRLISDQDLSLGSDSDIKLAAPQSSATRRKGAPAATPPYQPKSAISPGPKSPSKGIKALVRFLPKWDRPAHGSRPPATAT